MALYLTPNWIPLPAEGLAKTIVQASHEKFSFANAKSSVDITFVVCSAILSLVFLGGLETVREGTILSAIFVGRVVGFFMKRCKAKWTHWIEQ